MPSMTTGFRFARAVYTAAVNPAGPDPMMTMSRCWVVMLSLSVRPGPGSGGADSRSRVPLGPQERSDGHEDSAEGQPGRPDLALVQLRERAEQPCDQHHGRRQHDEDTEQAICDEPRRRLRRFDRAVARVP